MTLVQCHGSEIQPSRTSTGTKCPEENVQRANAGICNRYTGLVRGSDLVQHLTQLFFMLI